MTIQTRRDRQRADRHRLIIETARDLAESEGWDAVTIRRLADAIEYSQPVLYSHFAGKQAILGAVALQGFTELAETLRSATAHVADPPVALAAVARRYLDFATDHPALYEAMFSLATELPFAKPSTPQPLREGFAVLRETLGAATGTLDLDTRTELAWSTLHGLVTLTRGGRLRPTHHQQRLDSLVAQWQCRPATSSP